MLAIPKGRTKPCLQRGFTLVYEDPLNINYTTPILSQIGIFVPYIIPATIFIECLLVRKALIIKGINKAEPLPSWS